VAETLLNMFYLGGKHGNTLRITALNKLGQIVSPKKQLTTIHPVNKILKQPG
jgi:hypothetical protein